MFFLIFPTFLTSSEPTHFLGSAKDGRIFRDDLLDFEKCCSFFDCGKLANGLCDQELNHLDCAWDAGDCGYCNFGCFSEMIGNGKCDESCFNLECQFDGNDCRRRENLELEKDLEFITVKINNSDIQIAKNVETTVDSITFDKIISIQGEIEYEGSLLKKINLDLNGDITLENFDFSDSFENFYISVTDGIVKLKNICFNTTISIGLGDKEHTIAKSIKGLRTSGNKNSYHCIDFNYSSSNGSFSPKFSKSSENVLKIDEKSQITNISNLSSDFALNLDISNSNLTIKDSNISSFGKDLFKIYEKSILSIKNSNFLYKNTYFDIKNSSVLIVDSNLGNCNGGYVADISGSTLTVQNIEFKNCSFKEMKEIMKMTSCDNQTCQEIQSEYKSCPDGQMDLIVCTNCPENYYRFKNQDDLFCFKCPSTMNCTKGTIKPEKDIYQFEESDLNNIFRPCFSNESCRDPTSVNWTIDEQCEKKYTGKFCASCSEGYTSIGKYKCGKCPDEVLNGFILLISIALVSAMIIYFIKSTVISSFEPSEFYSIAIRIGINYFQVIYLCLQFRIAWPSEGNEEKAQGDSAGTKLKEGSNYYFSLQCLFKDFENHKTYYYARVTFMTIFPIIVFALSMIYLITLRIWNSKKFYMIKHRTKNTEDFKPSNLKIYTPVTFILPFLLIYPYVITYTLSPLACDSLENTKPLEYQENIDYSKYKYLMEVPDIWCTWSDHYQKIIWATGFSLIVWGFGVPIFIFYKLYQKRKNLFKYEVKYTFGFLISGYLHERFYWEFIIFIKKLMIVFLTVFMQTGYSITLQSILLITFLIAGFILQIYFKPYITDDLNKLEIAGTLAATITVLAAIIYQESNENSENLQMFLVFIISVVNISYIIYWLSFMSKELFNYIISSIDFLKKRFLKRDGFDREISKEYKNVDFVYIKEYQKLFTQAEFNEQAAVNYLGKEPSYKKLIKEIIATPLNSYIRDRGPTFRKIERLPTLVRLNRK